MIVNLTSKLTRYTTTAIALSLVITLALVPLNSSFAQQAERSTSVGKSIEDTSIKDVLGQPHSLFDDTSQCTVVAFIGWECPLVRQYVPRLNELQSEFASESVRWLTVNSNQHDSLTELQSFVRKFDLDIPLIKDVGNKLADAFAASRTPEVFLLNKDRKIVYQGRIDDQFTYGRQRPEVVTRFLADAIQQTLKGQAVQEPYVEAQGCLIGRVLVQKQTQGQEHVVTYSQQISRILQKNCASCHREGEIGPFALQDYDEVVGWAGMIQEVVNERRMPPWHADPEHGSFSNDCRLSEDEIQMINQWVDSGAPQGDPENLPEPIVYTKGWQIGEPDLIVPMRKRPYRVPATGTVEYQYFQVDLGFEEDKWVCAAECRPGNRAVIHHIIVGLRGEGDFGGRRQGVHNELQSDWIAATAPGSPPMILPEGYAKLVPAGSKLIFQMHYTPNGIATTDISTIGLKFIDPEEVTHRVLTMKAFNRRLRIPPGDENHSVNARFRFDQDAQLLSLFPHMHLRGKAFKYTAVYPDARQEVLLDVPKYDFNWQNGYQLTEPKLMPEGTRIKCVALFDNSDNNLANPDSTKTVGWGDQTWEEMMIGYFNVAIPNTDKPDNSED